MPSLNELKQKSIYPFEILNGKWICNNCKKEHDFRSDAENCYQLCKYGIDETARENDNLMHYLGFSRKKKYLYHEREVEIVSLYDTEIYTTFYPITIMYNDKLSGWLGCLTIEQACMELKDLV
jgi:hypothetical protein